MRARLETPGAAKTARRAGSIRDVRIARGQDCCTGNAGAKAGKGQGISMLDGLRVVEMASFVAGPSCGLHLVQLGASVIRIDPIQGGADKNRWPLAPDGTSVYWQGLNKGKKSVAIDLARPEGRELAVALITAPGEDAGIFLTNQAARGAFAHAALAAKRPDLISIRVMGWGSGETAVDYTVNATLGVPAMTGPVEMGDQPVNHVLPAWDLVCGAYCAFALMAAERHRRVTGAGGEVAVPLSDVAASALGNLGQVAEVMLGPDRPKVGNDVFGAFGRDFLTRDGIRLIAVAITPRQWSSLVRSLGIEAEVAALEAARGIRLDADEGTRFQHRDALNPLVARAIAARDFEALRATFDENGVCYARYRGLGEAVTREPIFTPEYGLFAPVEHPGGHRYPTPAAPARVSAGTRRPPLAAPRLGEHGEAVLAEVLGLPGSAIARLIDHGIIGRPD